jgi:hypothetical protein
VLEAGHLSLLAKARVRAGWSSRMLSASDALSASVLEIQDTNSIPNLPWSLNFGADFYNLAGWLMWRDQRKLYRKLPGQDLKVRMAEASGVDLNEEIVFTALRNRTLAQLIGFPVLSHLLAMFIVFNALTSLPLQFVLFASFLDTYGVFTVPSPYVMRRNAPHITAPAMSPSRLSLVVAVFGGVGVIGVAIR